MVYGCQQLSLSKNDFHTKNDQIYKYNTFNTQISFILGATCRYIINLLQVSTSKTQFSKFTKPSRPILAHSLTFGTSKLSRVQICRFIVYE